MIKKIEFLMHNDHVQLEVKNEHNVSVQEIAEALGVILVRMAAGDMPIKIPENDGVG